MSRNHKSIVALLGSVRLRGLFAAKQGQAMLIAMGPLDTFIAPIH